MNVPYPITPPLIGPHAPGPNTRAKAGLSRVTPNGALHEINSRRPLGINSQVPSGILGLLISPTTVGSSLLAGAFKISSAVAPKYLAKPGKPPLLAACHCQ